MAPVGGTDAVAPESAMPSRRGRGFWGAAAGLQGLSAVGTLVSFWALDRRCLPSGRPELHLSGRSCLAANVDALTLTYVGMFVGRGAIALAAVGGDYEGAYDGARDAWAQRPRRADLRRLRVGGGVALGLGAAVMVASTLAQWLSLPRCGSSAETADFERCVRVTLYAGWAANVAAGVSMSTGAGLLTYTSGYADAHRTWGVRRRDLAIGLSPRLSATSLGLSTRLVF